MTTTEMRHRRDTPPPSWSAWSFINLNLFQIIGAVFFAGAFILAVVNPPGVAFQWGTPVAFAVAAISYMLLLAVPVRRWVRVLSVSAPLLAAAARMFDFLWATPTRWNGTLTWAFVAFVFTWVGPRMMPPPLSNGDRKRWLADGGGGATVG